MFFFVYISLCNKQDNTARSQNNMRGLHQALCNMRNLTFWIFPLTLLTKFKRSFLKTYFDFTLEIWYHCTGFMENTSTGLKFLTKGIFSNTGWKHDNFWNMKLMVRSLVLKAKKAESIPAIRTKIHSEGYESRKWMK